MINPVRRVICRVPSCKRRVRSRGLCRNCYASAARLVRLGRTSWKKLEEEGKVDKPGGRPFDFLTGPPAPAETPSGP